jgi:hypothetical protein
MARGNSAFKKNLQEIEFVRFFKESSCDRTLKLFHLSMILLQPYFKLLKSMFRESRFRLDQSGVCEKANNNKISVSENETPTDYEKFG